MISALDLTSGAIAILAILGLVFRRRDLGYIGVAASVLLVTNGCTGITSGIEWFNGLDDFAPSNAIDYIQLFQPFSWGILVYTCLLVSHERDQRTAKAELTASDSLLRSVMESTDAAIVGLDERGYCVLANRAARTLLEARDDEHLRSAPFHELVGHTDGGNPCGTDSCAILAALAGRSPPLQQEQPLRRFGGSGFLATINAGPMANPDGSSAGCVVGLEDMTIQIQVRKHLLESQKLEMVGRLASGVTHDINNALHVVSMTLDYLEAEGSPREAIDDARDALMAATSLADRLLRTVKGRRTMGEVVDVSALISSGLPWLRRAFYGSSVQLVVKTPDEPTPILADRRDVTSAVLNLLVNARQAMGDEPGEVVVSVSVQDGSHVAVEVSDTGPGVEPSILDSIFDAFTSTKSDSGGSGLGLFMVHQVATNCGGAAQVRSVLGEGATFTLLFPLHLQEASPQRSVENARVLVVDDYPGAAKATSRLIRSMGLSVEFAFSATEARDLLDNQDFDVVLSDQDLGPGQSGIELLAELCEQGGAVPLLMTGSTRPPAGSSSDVPILRKPLDKETLAATLSTILSGR